MDHNFSPTSQKLPHPNELRPPNNAWLTELPHAHLLDRQNWSCSSCREVWEDPQPPPPDMFWTPTIMGPTTPSMKARLHPSVELYRFHINHKPPITSLQVQVTDTTCSAASATLQASEDSGNQAKFVSLPLCGSPWRDPLKCAYFHQGLKAHEEGRGFDLKSCRRDDNFSPQINFPPHWWVGLLLTQNSTQLLNQQTHHLCYSFICTSGFKCGRDPQFLQLTSGTQNPNECFLISKYYIVVIERFAHCHSNLEWFSLF